MASSVIKQIIDLTKLIMIKGATSGISDFNNIPHNSIVWANGTYTNSPYGPNRFSGHVLTIMPLTTHGFQVAIQYHVATIHIRAVEDNVWTNWKAITLN